MTAPSDDFLQLSTIDSKHPALGQLCARPRPSFLATAPLPDCVTTACADPSGSLPRSNLLGHGQSY